MNATGNNKRELARCVGLKPDHTTIQKGHFCAVCQGAVPGLNGLISMGNGMPYEVLCSEKKNTALDDASPELECSALKTDQSLWPKTTRAQKFAHS